VLWIERTPRYPGYRPVYDLPGRQGVPVLVDSARRPLTPARVRAIKRWPSAGDVVTFTAHVGNRGGADAPAWEHVWHVDGRLAARGVLKTAHRRGQNVTVSFRWRWQPGRHTIRFTADPLFKVRDLSLHNNTREDATDAWSLVWAVDRATYASFNRVRNFLGTRSFEDWAQWHVDHMNRLFDVSPTPWSRLGAHGSAPETQETGPEGRRRWAGSRAVSGALSQSNRPGAGRPAPSGWRPRIRCDRVIVLDEVEDAWTRALGREPLDAGYDGGWVFGRRADCTEWAASVDWGLIHEWGHQLGLTDLYALDRPGFQNLVEDERGDPLLLGRLSDLAGTMMHGHGPTLFSPECMGALITQQGRRRGYYGDHYYCTPRETVLEIRDSLGRPVPGARLEFWQDRNGEYRGRPVFAGTTDSKGWFRLPNRPAPAITTDGGYTQRDNPFGRIDVVGPGNVLFARIRARGHTAHTWLEITELNLAFWMGARGRAVLIRRTRIPPAGAPAAPAGVAVETLRRAFTLRWSPVPGAAAYRVHVGDSDGTHWRILANVERGRTELAGELPDGQLHRFRVAALDGRGVEGAWSREARALRLVRPWGLVVLPDGRRLLRDAGFGQALLFRADGSVVGPVGSVHHHFEGSYDVAVGPDGRILSAKWGDGYDPNPGFRVQDSGLNLVVDYRRPEGSEPGRVRRPMGIAADADGRIFLADTGNNRVQEFTASGEFVQVIGEGELRQPMKPALDRAGRLYVADSGNNRVAVYERDAGGRWVLRRSLTDGIKEPVCVAVDSQDRVFVSTNRVAGVYMFQGDKITWKYEGTPGLRLTGPRGLAFDGRGNLLVVDEATLRIWSIPLP